MKKLFVRVRSFGTISVFGAVCMLASCAKEGPTGPVGNTGPSFTGTVSGHVSLYDQYGGQVLGHLNLVQLSLQGATAIAPDTTGLYSYTAVTTGNYSIAATDSGYAYTVRTFNFVSGALNEDIRMSEIPVFASDTFVTVRDSAAQSDSLYMTFPADRRDRNCIVFVSNTPAVSNLVTSYLLAYTQQIKANDSVATLLVPAQDLYDAGFASGATAYYAVYSYVINDASVFEDPNTGKKVYYAVSNPRIDSAIVP